MATKRKNIICMMRLTDMNGRNGGVQSGPDDDVLIWHRPEKGAIASTIYGLNRREARLLARRINQFLDAGG